MKSILSFFLFALLASSSATALTITAYRQSPDGEDIQKFQFGKQIRYSKTSNFFDPKDDLRLGEFVPVNPAEFLSIKKEVEGLHHRLEIAAKALKTLHDIDMSDLALDERHAPVILLGGHKLHPRTLAYKQAYPILQRLMSYNWKLQKGIQLNTDGKVEKFSGNRKISSLSKQDYFRCRDEAGVQICQRALEVLYVK